MSVASGTEKRTAAQHLASIWGDGKRRIVVARRTSIRSGYQTLTYLPTQVIDDPHTIALIEEHGVDYIDLEVNGRPKRGKGLIDAEVDENKNIDTVAEIFGLPAAMLHDAIENGGTERFTTLAKTTFSALAERLKQNRFDGFRIIDGVLKPFKASAEKWTIDVEASPAHIALADKIDATLAGAISDEGLHEAMELLKESSRILRGEPPEPEEAAEGDGPSDDVLTGKTLGEDTSGATGDH